MQKGLEKIKKVNQVPIQINKTLYICRKSRHMNKSIPQILRYIYCCHFSDNDWSDVLKYCKEHGIKGAHRAIQPKGKSTYQQFVEWVENGFGVGDVVTDGNVRYLVGDALPDYAYAIAKVGVDGQLIIEDIDIAGMDLEGAWDYDEMDFRATYKALWLDLSPRLAKLVEIPKPKKWSKIRFLWKGFDCYGLVSDVDGIYVSFAYSIVNGEYLTNTTFRITQMDIVQFKKEHSDYMDKVLAENHVRWNQKAKKIEVGMQRAERGKTYWYIADVFVVRNGTETNTQIDKMRFQNGNYFIRHEDALDYLLKIMELRKEMEIPKTKSTE